MKLLNASHFNFNFHNFKTYYNIFGIILESSSLILTLLFSKTKKILQIEIRCVAISIIACSTITTFVHGRWKRNLDNPFPHTHIHIYIYIYKRIRHFPRNSQPSLSLSRNLLSFSLIKQPLLRRPYLRALPRGSPPNILLRFVFL